MPTNEPQPMVAFGKDAQSLPDDDFRQRHGLGFLMHHGPLGKLKPITGSATMHVTVTPGSAGNEVPPQLDFVVFPLCSRTDDPKTEQLTIGRTAECDVVINDESISKFHAVLHLTGGEFSIADAGSANGTLVNDEQVPNFASGATVLKAGDRVRLGSVEVTYLPAQQFRDVVAQLTSAVGM